MQSRYYIYAIAIAALLTGCRSKSPATNTSSAIEESPRAEQTTDTSERHFESRYIASRIDSDEEHRYMVDHFWDGFEFENEAFIEGLDTVEMILAFADYVAIIEPDRADSLLRSLIHRASANRPMLDYFAYLSEYVLHDPNSPLRNDDYYIPILETIIASPLMDKYDRIAYEYDLNIARKNRIGDTSADFYYTTADGRKAKMHDIEARYLLMMFSNPGCPMCREIKEEIEASPLINSMIDANELRILSIYPDSDIEAWRNALDDMPEQWIVAYDEDLAISDNHLYDLRAIPSLYLLDREKRVIIKDGTDVGVIESVLSM